MIIMDSFVLLMVVVLLAAGPNPYDCTHLTHQCHSGALRLNDSVLQICKHNQWKNVCYSNWGNLDAAVACRQLGIDGGYTNNTWISNHASTEVDSIVYDCTGRENHLQDCAHRDYGSSCSSSWSIILTCVNRSVSDTCSNGDIRFLGNISEYEGYIEVCTDHGLWSVVSNENWDYAEAAVTCRQLGFPDSIALPLRYPRSGDDINWLRPMEYGLNCRGNETTIQTCPISYYFVRYQSDLSWWNAYSAWNFAAVTCFPFPKSNGNCKHGTFRLANGYSSNNGLIEVCTHGLWVGMCLSRSYSSTTTIYSHICKHLGYQRYVELDGTVFKSNRTNPQFYLQPQYYCQSALSSPLDCIRNYTYYGFRYFQSCSSPIGVLCCPNDTALCSFRPMNTTSDCMTDGAVVTTANAAAVTTASSAPTTTSTVSAITSTASPSPDSESSTTPPEESKEAQFSLKFGAAATSLLLHGSSSDLRGLKADIEDKIMSCVSDKPDCPDRNNMAPVNSGFFSVGDILTYTSNLDKLYCVNALKKCLEIDPWIQYHGSDIHLAVSIV